MSYREYLKERCSEALSYLSLIGQITATCGWFIPVFIGMFYSFFNDPLAIYFIAVGAVWMLLVIAYMVYDHEKEAYKDWKENYIFNHCKESSNSKDETQGADKQ